MGSHLTDALTSEHEILVLDDFSTGNAENLKNMKCTIQVADVSKEETWKNQQGTEAVFALACHPRSHAYANPVRDMQVNYEATIHGLEYVRKHDAKFLFASNSGIVPKPKHTTITETDTDLPLSPYDLNKLASETLIRAYREMYGLQVLIFRFASVYGPRQRCHENWHPIIPHFFELMRNGEQPTIYGDGEQTRDFVHVSDIVSALTLGLEKMPVTDKIILGTETETSINKLYELIAGIVGFGQKPKYAPERVGDIKRMRCTNKRAKEMLGWTPKTKLLNGLQNYASAYADT